MRWLVVVSLLVPLGAGCGGSGSRRGGPPDGGSRDVGAGMDGGARDTAPPARACSSDPDCDDGLNCTLDSCGVGGVCRNLAEDSICGAGLRCDTTVGCTDEGCSMDADCQDGVYCNGAEKCIGGFCVMGTATDCDDGNACTEDLCDEDIDGCRYTVADGCDAGLPPPRDGGTPAVAFDATMHYQGRFLVAPSPSLGCPPASYAFGEITFSSDGTTLTVMADRFRMTQTPVPADGNFNVQSTADGNCNPVSLMGSFGDSNSLTATWRASCGGFCGSQTNNIYGQRAD